METGTFPWAQPWGATTKNALLGLPRNAATGQRYRGINVLTLGMSGVAFSSGDPRWATYKQAEERGWQVRRGERLLVIRRLREMPRYNFVQNDRMPSASTFDSTARFFCA